MSLVTGPRGYVRAGSTKTTKLSHIPDRREKPSPPSRSHGCINITRKTIAFRQR